MEVLFGLAFLMVPVAVVGGIIAWAVTAQKKREDTWARLAARLGLSYARSQVWGTLEGQGVQLRTEVRGSGKHRQTWTVVASFLNPPLDLGLSVYRQGFLSNTFGALFGAQDVAVGDPSFDPAYVVKADEPARAVALLGPELRAFFVRAHADRTGLHLADTGARIEERGMVSNEQWLEWALQTVAMASRLADAARANVPPATPLVPHRAAWMEFAKAAGLAGMDTPLCIWGRMEEASVSAYAVRVGHVQHRLEVLVRFDQGLGLGLLVRPTGTLDGIASFFGGQDHSFGDPAFDPAFVVKAPSADRLAEVLDADVRRRLVELASRGVVVQVRDDGVTVRAPSFPADASEVPRLVAEAKGVARAIYANASRREAPRDQPYR